MSQFFQQFEVQLIVAVAGLAVLVAIGVYAIGKVRSAVFEEKKQSLATSELMSDFRELHEQGGLSDQEFREIKQTLTAQMQAELRVKTSVPDAQTGEGLSPVRSLPSMRNDLPPLPRVDGVNGSADGVSDTGA